MTSYRDPTGAPARLLSSLRRRSGRRTAAALLTLLVVAPAAAQLDREIYEGGIAPNKLVWEEGDALPYSEPGPSDAAINQMIRSAEDLYNLLATVSGGAFLSWDGAAGLMRGVFEDTVADCPSWDAGTAYLCAASDGDDTIAREWAAGAVETTHEPFVEWQPGALAVSLADVFAEAADQLNGDGSDAPGGTRAVGACAEPPGSTSYRWLVGEDDAFGAARDLWAPECLANPGKVSSADYWCATADDGGVFANSTVPSHAFALLTDGGTYNGVTVGALGLTKTLAIWWRAQHEHLGATSDFSEFADALEQSCADLDLEGTDLPTPSVASPVAVPSGEEITAADCVEVADAIAAVELRSAPSQCAFEPLLDPAPGPALCAGGGAEAQLLGQSFESGLGGWSAGHLAVSNPDFDTDDWAVVAGLPDGRAGSAAFVADTRGLGDCAADVEAGRLWLESPAFVVPAASGVELAFEHWIATEAGLDGGNLRYSINGGGWTLVPASAFAHNGYNEILEPGSDNPMGGEPAFSGADEGAVRGSWGRSLVRFGALALPGDSVRFRFQLGLDGCDGRIGWYVDAVSVAACGWCGNGLLDAGEQCDDGDFGGGDGCSASCQIEPGWGCSPPVPPIPDSDRVANGGFEEGETAWTEASTSGFDLICNSCGPASEGDWLAWLGGDADIASLEQSVTVPADADTLRFELLVGVCASASDALTVSLGGVELFDTGSCAATAGYVAHEIPLGALADGATRLLRVAAVTSGVTNFFLDAVSIADPGVPGTPSECAADSSLIFADGFDEGHLCSWSAQQPTASCP